MLAEIKIFALTRQDIARSLRNIANEIEHEHPTVTHWGGHHGLPGSYTVSINATDAVDDRR